MGGAIKFLFFALAACPWYSGLHRRAAYLGDSIMPSGSIIPGEGAADRGAAKPHCPGGAVYWGEQHSERGQYAQGREQHALEAVC
jgi:hypothetical protein